MDSREYAIFTGMVVVLTLLLATAGGIAVAKVGPPAMALLAIALAWMWVSAWLWKRK